MKQFLCELLFTCTLLGPGAKPVDELTYGTVLYEYFQEEHQAALLNTLVAEAQDRRGEDPIRFELAAGSFAFADGMYAYANEMFAAIPEGELSDLDRMRLSFHLSREYHRRGDWASLGDQLGGIELGKTWLGRQKQHPEVDFMRGELAVQQGDYAAAEGFFAAMDEENPLRAYGLFNLGVTYRENMLLDEAQATFQRLADMPAYSDEAYDLSQRAKLALALIARQQQDSAGAESVLAALPGEGRYQEVAMAAFGGLAMDNEDYRLAARIWMTLQEEEYWTPSTATARLGFPLSLERMAESQGYGTTEMALYQYTQAEESFMGRLDTLATLSADAQNPQWIQGLLQVFATPERDEQQMQDLMRRWQDQLGHTDWLEWLATDNVHQALVQWRQLNGMESWLASLPEHLVSLQGVADEQLRRSEQAKVMLEGDGLLAQRDGLVAKAQALDTALGGATLSKPEPTSEWMYPLATDDEREILDELESMRALTAHMNDLDRDKWRDRISRLEGVLFFRVVEEQAKRVQALRGTHNELNELIADIDARIELVANAEDQFVAGVGTDFLVFMDRANDISQMVTDARLARETMLAQEIRGRMHQEMRQVQQYLLVTRIAIARATDQLAMRGAE